MGLMKELNDLNNIYQKMYDVDEAMLLTKADKKGNTPAWQNRDKKNPKTGKPIYKQADHLKNESVGSAVDKTLGAAGEIADTAIKLPAKAIGYVKGLKKGIKKAAKKGETKANEEFEISPEVEKLIESGKFSDAEIAKIADIQEADIADIIARLEKKRISKGGDPDESPLPAMKKYHADKKKKAKK